ncbi:hypothetical protein CC1G_15251 [Coprinopsis cinerea okayama7|uniref:F-box domain-containing protein n=1 Tax=Coprinopsis cinerea (strain Okayama-7 / 130 / ATCC MYA-4618 / FGSC 9003) TaxID=240176 RepID=D6RPV0_COPC7|nr:hypothetical protein CC1G_15251 [Coprinopsis cinerea okayama7\|eukprot:XP_002910343.1 hypothetical protein CC1G_15251 [Coprinopsis cinerea okayama7\
MRPLTFFSKAVAFLSYTGRQGSSSKINAASKANLQSRLLDLPPEVVLTIVEHCSLDSLKALRLTCRRMNAMLEELTLRTVTINISYDTLDTGIGQLQSLAQGWEKSWMTKKLRIVSLRPTYSSALNSRGFPAPERRKSDFDKRTVRATSELMRFLPLALGTFRRVNTIEITLHHQDVPGSWQVVMDWLPTLRHLHTFTFNALEASSGTLRQLQFGGLPYLKTATLNLKWPYANHASGTETLNLNLSRLVLRSPRLSSLSINIRHSSLRFLTSFKKTFLAAIEEVSPGPGPSSLTSLRLEGQIVIRPSSLLQLTGLKTLHLDNWQSRGLMEHVHPVDYELVSPAKLWRALEKHGVYLEEITAGMVPELAEYLRSYRELRALSVTVDQTQTPPQPLDLTFSNLLKSIARHWETLTSFEVVGVYHAELPGWQFVHEHAVELSRCRSLRTLRIPLPSSSEEDLNSCVAS